MSVANYKIGPEFRDFFEILIRIGAHTRSFIAGDRIAVGVDLLQTDLGHQISIIHFGDPSTFRWGNFQLVISNCLYPQT